MAKEKSDSFESLVAAKVAAGLSKIDAEVVAAQQIAEDEAAAAAPAGKKKDRE